MLRNHITPCSALLLAYLFANSVSAAPAVFTVDGSAVAPPSPIIPFVVLAALTLMLVNWE